VSRLGKVPINLPKGVDVRLEGATVVVKGPKGEARQVISPDIKVEVADGVVRFSPVADGKRTRAKWGLYRVLVNNMVEGVSVGFSKQLEIIGVGYRAEIKGKSLNLHVGYSHPVVMEPRDGVSFGVQPPNKVVVSGIDKRAVGQAAANIRRVRPPEPYKGKGIRYVNEVVRRKAGKAGAR
jgi:large subunit ribosomal protein L6